MIFSAYQQHRLVVGLHEIGYVGDGFNTSHLHLAIRSTGTWL